jgi:protein-tyrosine phosphatase
LSVIDLHCHVLAGTDDGPKTIEDSLALALAAAAAGVRTIVATPHVSARYPNDAATIERHVEETGAAFAAAGLSVNVVAGAEIAITRVGDLSAGELSALAISNGPWLLIEPAFTSVAFGLDTLLWELQERGHRIVLAHPERCSAFHRDPRMLASLVDSGILTSVTAGAFVGRFGNTVRRFALSLAEAEMVHNVSSDAHDADRRPPGMSAELEQCGLGPLREWLTRSVPSAIIEGEEAIPRRPAVAVPSIGTMRRPWWRRPREVKRAW